ncbi:adhesion G protein-coupled receptor F5 [Pempheris klunzingeri]|uniref:adhesion G protein-coupled receptor F5 n=1 Tax=Pempheris klunzingeri TaxID=3127111 RepID=UPI00397EF480
MSVIICNDRMWLFIFLYILGLNFHQATGQVSGNSTQMYYATLTIDHNVMQNITELMLNPLVGNSQMVVDDLKQTTICRDVMDRKECECKQHYKWSDKVCESNQTCCANTKCTFAKNSTMKAVYSTLRGFNTLTLSCRNGGINADFELTIAENVKPEDLMKKSKSLSANLSQPLSLNTTGFVNLSMPPNPVPYNSKSRILKCTVKENLKALPTWQLKRKGEKYEITNGTVSEVSIVTLETEVKLKYVTELWAGEYTCAYCQVSNSCSICHKASAMMDVCPIPNIYITADQKYPRCRKSSDVLEIKVSCEIGNSSPTVYRALAYASCDPAMQTIRLTCTFTNRCNQNGSNYIDINIINETEQYCEAEGDWMDTKAGFSAVLKCKNAAGQRERKCKAGPQKATWEPEVSDCVNWNLNSVLQTASVVDIGLGSADDNAAQTFSELQKVTNRTNTINSFSNINASVYVLFTLSEKPIQLPDDPGVFNFSVNNKLLSFQDFLESSSSLLDESLANSWKSKADNGNVSVAERFLSSVEQLIEMTNITSVNKKKNIEVAASSCSQESQCDNTVFDVKVALTGSDPGRVKTAGFKELEKYLPSNNSESEPNSIVVSTTTEKKQLDSVNVDINFKLLKKRPRNVLMTCVTWDNVTRDWSSRYCEWAGPSDEGRCICKHLSSFAILMSKHAKDIKWINEITYVGLAVSIASLTISLLIEMIVWSAVVKQDNSYLRHTAQVNISMCLLVADCCFLASSGPQRLSDIWCKTFVVVKQFCYLSMFFWMLCLSSTILHQMVFPFHKGGKKTCLKLSVVLGYVCPLLIVAITFIANKGGAEGWYFSRETCWLVYSGVMKGSIYTFVIPVGIIVVFNVFSMAVVIMKLLNHPKNTVPSHGQEKKDAIAVIRIVVLLTPIFGVTWIFGFALMLLDLTYGIMAYIVNYAFTLLNAFQGLFILLTTCLGDKQVCEALLNRLKHNAPSSTTDSSTKSDSTWKK